MSKTRRIIFALEIILLIVLVVSYIRARATHRPLRRELADLRGELRALGSENIRLKQQLRYLKSDENLRREARDKFNLAEPGEKLIILPPGW